MLYTYPRVTGGNGVEYHWCRLPACRMVPRRIFFDFTWVQEKWGAQKRYRCPTLMHRISNPTYLTRLSSRSSSLLDSSNYKLEVCVDEALLEYHTVRGPMARRCSFREK